MKSISYVAFALMLALGLAAAGQADASPAKKKVQRSCAEVMRVCMARSDPRYAGGCYSYYGEAKRTGVWPAFGTFKPFSCRN